MDLLRFSCRKSALPRFPNLASHIMPLPLIDSFRAPLLTRAESRSRLTLILAATIIIAYVIAVIACASIYGLDDSPIPIEPSIYTIFGLFTWYIWGVYRYIQRLHKSLARLRHAQFRFCPHCTHTLHSSEVEFACTSCGTTLRSADLRSTWVQSYLIHLEAFTFESEHEEEFSDD